MRRLTILLLTLLLLSAGPVSAQGGGTDAPVTVRLEGFRHEFQGWNNCGPATLTIGLSHFGWTDNQLTAADWLKPNTEDKNVSPWQMAEFANTFSPARAVVRYGGSLPLLKSLLAAGFPVIIEAGFEPDGFEWMGHYLLVMGYDDPAGTFLTQDSFLGPDRAYPQAELDAYWRHFNRAYLVLYAPERESEMLTLLGDDADEGLNAARAVETARQEATAAPDDPYAWFNLGSSLVLQGQYAQAAVAFDQARNVGPGLPWRMLWYQFGPFEAYYQTGRYADVIALAQYNLATTPDDEHVIEETYYYAGLARAALGESERAIENLRQAVFINPNFSPAVAALADLEAGGAGG